MAVAARGSWRYHFFTTANIFRGGAPALLGPAGSALLRCRSGESPLLPSCLHPTAAATPKNGALLVKTLRVLLNNPAPCACGIAGAVWGEGLQAGECEEALSQFFPLFLGVFLS